MNQASAASQGDASPRPRRYCLRLLLGLAMLLCAAGATAWVAWGAMQDRSPGASGAFSVEQVNPTDYVKLGARSVVAVALCAGVILCTAGPIRRGAAGSGRLAMVELGLSGLLLAAVVLMYWLFWCPLSFLK